jgi:hypothetical protein
MLSIKELFLPNIREHDSMNDSDDDDIPLNMLFEKRTDIAETDDAAIRTESVQGQSFDNIPNKRKRPNEEDVL